LLPYLQPYFESIRANIGDHFAEPGAAIEKARNGDADCLLVHSKSAEEDYCNEGYGGYVFPLCTITL
jgi:tungstate transport system substrate-binding protein